jgi:hypothetical protein
VRERRATSVAWSEETMAVAPELLLCFAFWFVLKVCLEPVWFLSAFPDGKRLVYSRIDRNSADLYPIENFQ